MENDNSKQIEARTVDDARPAGAKKVRRNRGEKPSTEVLVIRGTEVTDSGTVTMDAKEFERFEQCIANPKKPTKAMVEAAKLHQMLASKR